MRYLYLTPLHLLPDIIPEDQELAERIVNELNLSMDEISWLIRTIRKDLSIFSLPPDGPKVIPLFKNTKNKTLLSSDSRIEKITVQTNKGIIDTDKSDSIFHDFTYQINREREALKQKMEGLTKSNIRMIKDAAFRKIFIYLYFHTSLVKHQRHVAEGYFLIHFKLGGYKPILSKEEYSPINKPWKSYLADIALKREEKFLKEFSV